MEFEELWMRRVINMKNIDITHFDRSSKGLFTKTGSRLVEKMLIMQNLSLKVYHICGLDVMNKTKT